MRMVRNTHIYGKADHGPTLGSRGCQVRVARRKFDSTLVLIDHDGQLQYRHRRRERHRLFDLVPLIKKSLRDAFSYSRTRWERHPLLKTTVGAIAAKKRKNQRSLRCLAFRFIQQPNMWNKQWKVGHSPASSSTSKACGVKYCELASRVDVGWDVASHCLFSSLGPCILGYVPALGLTFGPAILLFVSLFWYRPEFSWMQHNILLT